MVAEVVIISPLRGAEAAVLAGGASRRMGEDKAWLDLGGTPAIARILETLEPLFDRTRIIANDPSRFARLSVPVQSDLRPGSGALGGLHAALKTAKEPALFVTACDMPFVTQELVRGLYALLLGFDAVVPWSAKGPDPLCAFYRAGCLPAIEAALDRKDFRVGKFLSGVRVHRVEGEALSRLDPTGEALFNLNTPEDYARAQLKAGSATRAV